MNKRLPPKRKQGVYKRTPKALHVGRGGYRSVYDQEYALALQDYDGIPEKILRWNLRRLEKLPTVDMQGRCDAIRELLRGRQ